MVYTRASKTHVFICACAHAQRGHELAALKRCALRAADWAVPADLELWCNGKCAQLLGGTTPFMSDVMVQVGSSMSLKAEIAVQRQFDTAQGTA